MLVPVLDGVVLSHLLVDDVLDAHLNLDLSLDREKEGANKPEVGHPEGGAARWYKLLQAQGHQAADETPNPVSSC